MLKVPTRRESCSSQGFSSSGQLGHISQFGATQRASGTAGSEGRFVGPQSSSLWAGKQDEGNESGLKDEHPRELIHLESSSEESLKRAVKSPWGVTAVCRLCVCLKPVLPFLCPVTLYGEVSKATIFETPNRRVRPIHTALHGLNYLKESSTFKLLFFKFMIF